MNLDIVNWTADTKKLLKLAEEFSYSNKTFKVLSKYERGIKVVSKDTHGIFYINDMGTMTKESASPVHPEKFFGKLVEDWTDKPTEVKLDAGKLRYDLMPFDALDEVAKVLTYGIMKYPKPEENWRVNSTEEDIKRYQAAMLRHMSEMMQDRPLDAESGLHHISHIATNSLFIVALLKKYGKDMGCLKKL
jgi:hypothetical protein